jgi:hypothetical protein
MSETPFAPDPRMPPLMTPAKARDIGRSLYGLAQSYADSGMVEAGTAAFRQSEWWLSYARTLAASGPAEEAER